MKSINKILLSFLLILPVVACNENLMENDKGETPLALKINTQDVVLDIYNPAATALNFQWTTGTNAGTGAAISYQFQITLAGKDFTEGITYDLGKNVLQMLYSNETLNSLLIDSLGVTAGSETKIQARVTATVLAGSVQPQTTASLTVKVKTYKPVPMALYMIGDAAPNGWNADDATKMNVVNGTAGGFTWQGHLKSGELKFITTPGAFLPSYNRGETETTLVYREEDNQPDNKFVIAAGGIYKISLNLLSLAINIEQLEAPEYGELWFVGGFTAWSFVPMTSDLTDPYIFHYNAKLETENATDEFKIATAQNFDATTVFYHPVVNDQGAGTNLMVVKYSESENAADNKWSLAAGTYKIRFNQRTMKMDIVPFTPFASMYLVGEATPNGWDIGNAVEMEAVSGNPYQFTWTGHLNKGEIKFTCDRKDSWDGAFFVASQGGITPSGTDEQMIFCPNGSNPDNKWVIATAGTYTIELDQLQDIVKFVKI